MRARVTVTLKSGVLDPQGKAIEGALAALGIEGVTGVRQGKVFDIELDDTSAEAAKAVLTRACERLLANTVVESYEISLGEPELAISAEGVGSVAPRPLPATAPSAAVGADAAAAAEMPAEGHP